MPTLKQTCTYGTSFVLERSVAVFSRGHGGQVVSVSLFPRFHKSAMASWIQFDH